ncbi:MAG: hypothetical protein IPJ34_43240 [Myxococcales bacterium]|nr:hypothetical protein [Myxococcales bacterium]
MRRRRLTLVLGALAIAAACSRRTPQAEPVTKEVVDAAAPKPSAPVVTARVPRRHRAKAERCTDLPLRIGHPIVCKADADCPGRDPKCTAGRCTELRCRQDDDCGKGSLCMCGMAYERDMYQQPHSCLVAECRTDGDCGPSRFCSPSVDLECGWFRGVVGWYCHRPEDQCLDDEDCVDPGHPDSGRHGYCSFSPVAGHFVCGFGLCLG